MGNKQKPSMSMCLNKNDYIIKLNAYIEEQSKTIENFNDLIKHQHNYIKELEGEISEIRENYERQHADVLHDNSIGVVRVTECYLSALNDEISRQGKEIKHLKKEFNIRGGKLAQMTHLVKIKYGNSNKDVSNLVDAVEEDLLLTKHLH